MSSNEIIGQLFLARDSRDKVQDQIQNYFPTGFFLFAKDLVNYTEAELKKELK
jgi:hypothetical protein